MHVAAHMLCTLLVHEVRFGFSDCIVYVYTFSMLSVLHKMSSVLFFNVNYNIIYFVRLYKIDNTGNTSSRPCQGDADSGDTICNYYIYTIACIGLRKMWAIKREYSSTAPQTSTCRSTNI